MKLPNMPNEKEKKPEKKNHHHHHSSPKLSLLLLIFPSLFNKLSQPTSNIKVH